MKYLAQLRTQMTGGSWTQWSTAGDPMDEAEADEYLRLLVTFPLAEGNQARVIVVPEDFPSVFMRLVTERST